MVLFRSLVLLFVVFGTSFASEFDSGTNDMTYNGTWSPADGGGDGQFVSGEPAPSQTNVFNQNVTISEPVSLSDSDNTFSGNITMSGGTFDLSGGSNTFSGNITMSGGTFDLSGATNSFGDATKSIDIQSPGVFKIINPLNTQSILPTIDLDGNLWLSSETDKITSLNRVNVSSTNAVITLTLIDDTYPTIAYLDLSANSGNFPKIILDGFGTNSSQLFYITTLKSATILNDSLTLSLSTNGTNFSNCVFTNSNGDWSYNNGQYLLRINGFTTFDSGTNDMTYNGTWTPADGGGTDTLVSGTPLFNQNNVFNQNLTLSASVDLSGGSNTFSGNITMSGGTFDLSGATNSFGDATKSIDIQSSGVFKIINPLNTQSILPTIDLDGNLWLSSETDKLTSLNRVNVSSTNAVMTLTLIDDTYPTIAYLDLSANSGNFPKIILNGFGTNSSQLFYIDTLISNVITTANISLNLSKDNGGSYNALQFTYTAGATDTEPDSWSYTDTDETPNRTYIFQILKISALTEITVLSGTQTAGALDISSQNLRIIGGNSGSNCVYEVTSLSSSNNQPVDLTLDSSLKTGTNSGIMKLNITGASDNLDLYTHPVNLKIIDNGDLFPTPTDRNIFYDSYSFTSMSAFQAALANYITINDSHTITFSSITILTSGMTGTDAWDYNQFLRDDNNTALGGSILANSISTFQNKTSVTISDDVTTIGDNNVVLTQNCDLYIDESKSLTLDKTIDLGEQTLTKFDLGNFNIAGQNVVNGTLLVKAGSVLVNTPTSGVSIDTLSLSAEGSAKLIVQGNASINTITLVE
jgi:hypothetical protein